MSKLIEAYGTLILILGLLAVLFFACTLFSGIAPSSDDAKMAVEEEGYTDVQVSGPNLWKARFYCGEDDDFYFKVEYAINSNDMVVTNMYVCSGLFKGYTIRHHRD